MHKGYFHEGIMHKISVDTHKNQNQNNNGRNVTDNGNSDKFAVEERRRQVASMLSQSMTETEYLLG